MRRVPRQHGTVTMYRKVGCRCDDCKAAKTDSMRVYAAKRSAEGRPIDFKASRSFDLRECGQCSGRFKAYRGRVGKFCSSRCALDAQGYSSAPRFRIGYMARNAIYERDNWTCQLCFMRLSLEAHYLSPTAPTLDHIQPRAHGGPDDESNLRLACRDCNNKRKTNIHWKPEVIHG